MTDYQNIIVDVDGGVATITLNRPEKLNALSEALRNDLAAALRELNPGDAVRVIRIKAAGRAFCAGYDITPNDNDFSFVPSRRRGDQAWELGESMAALNREQLRDSIDRWLWIWSYRKPIIAQVPLDGLTVHKHSTNRWFELMGLRMSAIEGAEFNTIFAEAPTIAEFGKISREKGLKVALEWRDDPFGDGRGALRRRT